MTKDSLPVTITRGGMGSALGGPSDEPHAIAPTTGEAYNTLAQPLRPVASWRIDSHRFEVGSSFLLANSVDEFALLGELRPPAKDGDDATAPRLAVFGHADATGTDTHNKTLAGRRARSVYALLVRDVDAWESLHASPANSDKWGPRMLRLALAALGYPSGRPTNEWSEAGKQALRDFQAAQGLPASGDEDKASRLKLFAAYMDLVCTTPDGPLVYKPNDFLGEGADKDGQGAYQGCGEVNPLVIPSKKRLEFLEKPENHPQRDEAYRNNRRVVIYAFPTSLKIRLDKWPCPRAKESGDGCKKMFWNDGDSRRQPTERPREHAMHDRTFACRFYDRFARLSPSERTRRTIPVHLLDNHRQRMPMSRFRASFDDATVEGVADSEGKALVEGAFVSRELDLQWGALPGGTDPDDFAYHATLYLDPEDEPSDDEGRAAMRLANLGYHRGNFDANVAAFQADHELEPNPWPDAATRDLLYSTHLDGTEADQDVAPGDGDDAYNDPRGGVLTR